MCITSVTATRVTASREVEKVELVGAVLVLVVAVVSFMCFWRGVPRLPVSDEYRVCVEPQDED